MTLARADAAAALDRFARRAAPDESVGARAAVCVLLVADGDDVALVITRRSSAMRNHSGQWAFPGGRIDPGESAPEAALRELEEELGVTLPPDRILGALDDYVTRSGFCITPVVVWAVDAPFDPTPAEAEVASVHLIPLDEIDVDPVFLTIPESPRPVVQMPIRGSRIHAPTGAILYQFREVVLHGRPTRVADLEQPVFAWR